VCGNERIQTAIKRLSSDGHLLDDVPEDTVLSECHQPIVDGHLVKLGRLLVAEKRVRYPDLGPAVFAEPDFIELGAVRFECEARVAPLLT